MHTTTGNNNNNKSSLPSFFGLFIFPGRFFFLSFLLTAVHNRVYGAASEAPRYSIQGVFVLRCVALRVGETLSAGGGVNSRRVLIAMR